MIGLLAGIVILRVKIKSSLSHLITAAPNAAISLFLNKHFNVMALGKWDAESKMLYVQAAFPCASTERREDDGSTGMHHTLSYQILYRDPSQNSVLFLMNFISSQMLSWTLWPN